MTSIMSCLQLDNSITVSHSTSRSSNDTPSGAFPLETFVTCLRGMNIATERIDDLGTLKLVAPSVWRGFLPLSTSLCKVRRGNRPVIDERWQRLERQRRPDPTDGKVCPSRSYNTKRVRESDPGPRCHHWLLRRICPPRKKWIYSRTLIKP